MIGIHHWLWNSQLVFCTSRALPLKLLVTITPWTRARRDDSELASDSGARRAPGGRPSGRVRGSLVDSGRSPAAGPGDTGRTSRAAAGGTSETKYYIYENIVVLHYLYLFCLLLIHPIQPILNQSMKLYYPLL